LDEEKVNAFLDAILEFKIGLEEKTEKIYDINDRIEKITWFNDLDETCLMLLNDLISSAKDLRSSLIRQYVSMNDLRKKGIAKEAIKDFKNSIDELKEAYEDLESVFFFLPEMPDFKETTSKLSLV
jgi:histidyl-tRNA synthetase